ncbi:max-binding protein MNT-like isoform X2 [Pectinophora gossypiella]|uniref:max-binding protein MNT-like isoform X2 n=1 Tax=Pectinophora gossypiella TaxID=13191 RepID=UPI00214E7917|nr:max-binding protein MNT-like isoform X2 [Pectinophora gossypiella]
MGILMETTDVNLGTASYRGRRAQPELFGAMGTPSNFFAETVHTIAINTRETEFGSIVEPIPITLKTYKQFQAHGHQINGYGYPQQMVTALAPLPSAPRIPDVERPSTSSHTPNPVKEEAKDPQRITRPPPKKKWIKEYLEEEPKSPVSVRVVTGLAVTPRSNGVVRATSPLPPVAAPPAVAAAVPEPAPAPPPALFLDFVQEHSRPRTTSNSHGPPQIPSPPSVSSNGSGSGSNGSSNGSAPRAGTREVHNKLEKNRRAHLKECFELLKRQLPATPDDKKTSNLSILGSAIRYIQVLRRKERECEHEMERLAREKIAAQQRLAALKREVSVRATTVRPRSIGDGVIEEKDREDSVNGQVVGIPISITSSPPRTARMDTSPPRTLNLSTKLRTLPIQITPTTSQVVRTSYGARHNTLTLTTLAPADPPAQNGQPVENGVTNTLSATTLVHPAQIHLPLSQVVGSGGLVVGPAALQLLSAGGGLRVLQAPVHNGQQTHWVTTSDNNRIPKENGIVSPPPASTGSVVVSGLTPLVVSQPTGHLLQTHTLAHKMVETQVVKGSVAPLTVSAQYLSATTIVKPVVVVSSAPTQPGPPT